MNKGFYYYLLIILTCAAVLLRNVLISRHEDSEIRPIQLSLKHVSRKKVLS